MTYNEVGSGGAKTGGCVIVLVSHQYVTMFGIGDILYNIHKARKGVLEKVVIKELVPIKQSLTYGQFRVIYKDTLNALWNETDLVDLETAKDLAEEYYEDLLARIAALEQSNCP